MRTIQCCLLLAIASLAAAQTKPRVTTDDLMRTVSVSDPQLSPDGKTIACIVSRPNVAEDRYDSEIVLVDVASGKQRALTFERRHVNAPRWSPGGDRLAFLDNAPTGEKKEPMPQIWVLPMDGGEARRITSAPTGVQHFAWRPDGGALAFAAEDEKPERKDRAKHEDAFEVGNLDYLAKEFPRPAHVWLVDAAGGTAKRITTGAWSLPTYEPPGPVPSPLSWSPDGKQLLITRQETPVYGDSDQTKVQVVDVAAGTARPLTKN